MATRKSAGSAPAPLQTVVQIPLTQIDAADDTFRQRAIMAVDDLVAELRETPQQVPIFVRCRKDGRYQIIAGFRRVHALKALHRPHVAAIVVAADDASAWRLAWAENAGRRRVRGADFNYFVYKLHDEGKNHDEIAELCGMTARDRARVAALGKLPDAIRKSMRALGLSLRHAAVVAAFVARHPRVDIEATLSEAAKLGLSEAKLAARLERLTESRGRKSVGVKIRDQQRFAIDIGRADPASWTEPVKKSMRALHAWLDQALAEGTAKRPRGRPKK